MTPPNKSSFLEIWPKCFVAFVGVIEILAIIVLILTELGNVAANFWTTNVFAGGWCALIMFIHVIALFVSACCAPGPSAAFRAVIVTIIALVACAALIAFDALFIAQPTTCILTPSCSSNANSTTIFNYSFRSSFFSVFNSLNPFQSYSESQAKFLFQVVQLGVGSLCFVLCIIFLIVYYVSKNRASKQVKPEHPTQNPRAPQPNYNAPQPNYNAPQPNQQRYPQPRGYQGPPANNYNKRY